jgi:large subunit ribosomal protein L17
LGKKNTNASRINAFSSLRDGEAVTKVFSDLSKRFEKRNGGYCRIVKAGFRTGDKAPMAYIQLLDQEAK